MILLNGCLFIHIPKTGGTSIRTAMASDKSAVMLTRIEDYLNDDVRVNLYNPHALPAEIKPALGGLYERLWKFTFVRNPWNRYVSCYFYRQEVRPFDEFLEDIFERGFTTISQYLKNTEYQFVGRQETLQDDWNTVVAKRLGIKPKPLPRLNVAERQDHSYVEMYNDKTRALVAEKERLLLNLHPYEFGQ
jgi:hypothetical protein